MSFAGAVRPLLGLRQLAAAVQGEDYERFGEFGRLKPEIPALTLTNKKGLFVFGFAGHFILRGRLIGVTICCLLVRR